MRRVAKERPERCVFALNKRDRAPFYETMFRDLWNSVAQERDRAEPLTEPRWVTCSGVRPGGCDALLDAR